MFLEGRLGGGVGGRVGNGHKETFWEAGNALDLNLSGDSIYVCIYIYIYFLKGRGCFTGSSVGKESACNGGD